jgi:hypothetical protein
MEKLRRDFLEKSVCGCRNRSPRATRSATDVSSMTGVISLRVAAPRKLNDYSLEIIMGQTEIVFLFAQVRPV